MIQKIILQSFLFLLPSFLFSQNVGIGTTTPTRAKLEVHGAAGYTSGIFGGESSGISLQRNWPGIGLNEYFSTSSKYMSNGYAAKFILDPGTGYMAIDMFGNGVANDNTIYAARALTIANNGNIGIKTSPANASLYVLKGTNFEGSAVFGGTTYNSNFSHSITEDTYIRGGKNASNVIINDIPNGNIQMGNGSSKVGINTLPYAPATALEINGGVSLRTGIFTITTVNRTITVGDRSFISIYNASQPSHPVLILSNGLTAGQILIIHGDVGNGTEGFIVGEDGYVGNFTNTDIEGTGFRVNANSTISFIWTGTIWVELCRSNNKQ